MKRTKRYASRPLYLEVDARQRCTIHDCTRRKLPDDGQLIGPYDCRNDRQERLAGEWLGTQVGVLLGDELAPGRVDLGEVATEDEEGEYFSRSDSSIEDEGGQKGLAKDTVSAVTTRPDHAQPGWMD